MGNEQSAAGQPADVPEVNCGSLPGDGPSAREAAGAFFSKGGNSALVVFGGHGTDAEGADQAHNDVWVLPSGAGWQQCSPEGRAALPRSGHTVSSVADVGLLIFGGLCHEKGYLSDVTLLAPVPETGSLAWSPVCATGEFPTGRDKHTAVVAPATASVGARLLCFGGFGVMPPNDEDEDEDEEGEGAGGRDVEGEGGTEQGGDGDADEPRGPSVDMGWFGDVFELEVETWRWRKLDTQASSSSPAARAAHACCFFGPGGEQQAGQQAEQRGEHMLLFGGRTAAGRVNDTWLLDLGTKAWAAPSLAGCPPSARSFHSAVSLTSRAGAPLAAVFGGLDAASTHVRLLQPARPCLARAPLRRAPLCMPRARPSARRVRPSARRVRPSARRARHSPRAPTKPCRPQLNDLHLLDTRGWAWVSVRLLAAPSPRGCGTLCAVPSTVGSAGDLLLFGGSCGWEAEAARALDR